MSPASSALGRRGFFAALAGGWLGWVPPARASSRKAALVIGNAAYRRAPLKNPVNDARAVATALGDLGFDLTLRENTTQAELIETLRRFSVQASEASVRVVFYAGHGVQLKGRNYLLPVDNEIGSEDELRTRSADLTEFLERLGTIRQGINVVILDACRNNPFSGALVTGPDGRQLKFRGATPAGLAAVEAPLGSMIAFSTAPGGVALDNPKDRHSLYAKHLLDHLRAPGLPVELLFKRVRLAVAQETGRVQVPWESSSLTGEFCFRAGADGSCSTLR